MGQVKGDVSRAYDNQTTDAMVGERLRHALLKVETTTEGRDLVGRIIASTDMEEGEQKEALRAAGGHEEKEVFPVFVVAAEAAAAEPVPAEEGVEGGAQEEDSDTSDESDSDDIDEDSEDDSDDGDDNDDSESEDSDEDVV